MYFLRKMMAIKIILGIFKVHVVFLFLFCSTVLVGLEEHTS